jgi:hypothetical protein
MKVQEYVIENTQQAAAEAFRYAKAVPADKLEWAPGGDARSALDLCRELAVTPTWTIDTIEGTESESRETQQALMASLKTVEACEAEYEKRAVKMLDLFRSISDDRLKETKFLPYDGGRDFTVAQMMDYPRWNCNYHLGQIAMIQLMLGDKEMH